MSNFHPLEGVGRGSEPQLHVGEKLNNLFKKYENLGQRDRDTAPVSDCSMKIEEKDMEWSGGRLERFIYSGPWPWIYLSMTMVLDK